MDETQAPTQPRQPRKLTVLCVAQDRKQMDALTAQVAASSRVVVVQRFVRTDADLDALKGISFDVIFGHGLLKAQHAAFVLTRCR